MRGSVETPAWHGAEGLLSLSRPSRQPLALEKVVTEDLGRAVFAELAQDLGGSRAEVE